jgi:hypothetical protein
MTDRSDGDVEACWIGAAVIGEARQIRAVAMGSAAGRSGDDTETRRVRAVATWRCAQSGR